MKQYKKTIALALALVLSLSLAACASKTETAASTEAASTETASETAASKGTITVAVACAMAGIIAGSCLRDDQFIEASVYLTPESSSICFIQIINGTIFLFQPVTKCFLAQRTMTFSAILIGNMPQDHTRMCGNLLCQLFVNNMYLLSVNRRSITMIMSESK